MICLPLQTMDNALWNTKNWKNKVRIFIFIYQRKKDYVSFPLCSNLHPTKNSEFWNILIHNIRCFAFCLTYPRL